MRGLIATGVLAMLLLVAGCADPASPTQAEPSPSARSQHTPSSKTATPEPLSPAEQAALNRKLIEAAWDNDVDRARQLIRAGAEVNYEDETEQSAFLIAASEGYLELLNLTLRGGADVHARDSYNGTALIRAAERGHADVVARLLRTDVNVNHVNNLGWTALHEAIILGDGSARYVRTVRLLVEGGADVTLPSQRDGRTPLQHAESQGFEKIAAILRDAGAQ